MMKTHFCPHEGGITHDDDSVFLNTLAIDGTHFSVIHLAFRTVLGFPSFLYVNLHPQKCTYTVAQVTQSRQNKKTRKQTKTPKTFKTFVLNGESKSCRVD